jgi:amino acid adenylation domain-containing protein
MINHQGLFNRLICMQEKYALSYLDHILQKTPFTFDVSVWEILLPLITGALEVIAKPHGHKDIEYIYNIIKDKNISVIHFVPSMLDLYLQTKNTKQENHNHKSLRLTIASGEALPFNLTKEHYSKCASEIHNLYGPTEASIDVTAYACNLKQYQTSIPIGRPISNTQIYILDSYMNPVPVGVNGEIYIGGAGLARGYLNRPDLTAERFIPNPFGEESLRLYRTGDLARYLPDGNIEFLGRIDDQVKIRGFRIELGEIESVLCSHGNISQAVIVVREDEPGHKQLVAYVVEEEDGSTMTTDLQEFLSKKLPDYMIPAFFVFMDKIPLTSNGKIDKKSFPSPDLSLRQRKDEYIAPQTDLQKELCSIWSETV